LPQRKWSVDQKHRHKTTQKHQGKCRTTPLSPVQPPHSRSPRKEGEIEKKREENRKRRTVQPQEGAGATNGEPCPDTPSSASPSRSPSPSHSLSAQNLRQLASACASPVLSSPCPSSRPRRTCLSPLCCSASSRWCSS
jgi:hypothetical protein